MIANFGITRHLVVIAGKIIRSKITIVLHTMILFAIIYYEYDYPYLLVSTFSNSGNFIFDGERQTEDRRDR